MDIPGNRDQMMIIKTGLVEDSRYWRESGVECEELRVECDLQGVERE